MQNKVAGIVAIILASGVAIGLILITGAVLMAAWVRLGVDADSGLSENGTQLLSAIFGGVISTLSGWLGFSLGERKANKLKPEEGV